MSFVYLKHKYIVHTTLSPFITFITNYADITTIVNDLPHIFITQKLHVRYRPTPAK